VFPAPGQAKKVALLGSPAHLHSRRRHGLSRQAWASAAAGSPGRHRLHATPAGRAAQYDGAGVRGDARRVPRHHHADRRRLARTGSAHRPSYRRRRRARPRHIRGGRGGRAARQVSSPASNGRWIRSTILLRSKAIAAESAWRSAAYSAMTRARKIFRQGTGSYIPSRFREFCEFYVDGFHNVCSTLRAGDGRTESTLPPLPSRTVRRT
jgi:hypothetical protein